MKRGFTLIEVAVVLAIVTVVSTLAYSNFSRQKPRAQLAGAAAELQALLHEARQSALAGGTPVDVLFYKSYGASLGDGQTSKGYVIVYRDACFDFFTAAPPCGVGFRTYDPAVLAAGSNGTAQSAVLETLPIPSGLIIGPPTGMGASAKIPAPLSSVPVNVDCSFCGSTAGAVQFDPQGHATFYSLSGTTLTGPLTATSGGSITLGYDPSASGLAGERTLVILSASGAVEVLTGG